MDHFEDRLVRIDEILALTGLSRTKLYDLIAEGTFPTQVRVGPRSVRWRLSEVLGMESDPGLWHGRTTQS